VGEATPAGSFLTTAWVQASRRQEIVLVGAAILSLLAPWALARGSDTAPGSPSGAAKVTANPKQAVPAGLLRA
jgi:hypothetical protein